MRSKTRDNGKTGTLDDSRRAREVAENHLNDVFIVRRQLNDSFRTYPGGGDIMQMSPVVECGEGLERGTN